jgi:hypothetical protein
VEDPFELKLDDLLLMT